MTEPTSERVLELWFGTQAFDSAVLADRMHIWFGGDPAFDRRVAAAFGAAIEPCARGAHSAWADTARGALALILILDQFPRHVHRGTSRAFEYDAAALAVCRRALAQGLDLELGLVERQFIYLPLQHSESQEDQQLCVAAFTALRAEVADGHWLEPVLARALSIAQYHALIIRRYGRYPHRNEALGRSSTLAERMYLDAGGPSFGQTREPGAPSPREATPAPARPVFRLWGPGVAAADALCVDGKVDGLRCLSHWPGTVAPAELQHDLSTGMALKYSRASDGERRRWLGSFSVVTNDHYDTDGALAAFALIHPDQSLEHADLMLRAAATGDLRTFTGEDALAVDLTVWSIANSPDSPVVTSAGADYAARAGACYAWLLDELPTILRAPFTWRALWQARFERILAELRAVDARDGVAVEALPELDLAVVTSRVALTRHALIRAAGALNRVLYVFESPEGCHYRFLYRNESWFLGLRDRVPPRLPLEPVRARLAALETAPRGGWWCTRLERTSAQLGFGSPDDVADVFEDLRPDRDPPSQLAPERVVEVLRRLFSGRTAAGPATSLLRSTDAAGGVQEQP